MQESSPETTKVNASKTIVNTLVKLLEEGDEADRCYAARALGSIRAEGAVSELQARLRDDDIDVCIDSAEALGKLGESESLGNANVNNVVEALNEVANFHPDDDAKLAAASAIAKIGDSASIEILMKMLNEPDNQNDFNGEWNTHWDIQLMAVICLGEHRVAKAIPLLQALVISGDQQDIEQELLRALSQIGGEGTDVVNTFLTNGNVRLRRRAAKSLADSPDNHASIALFKALKDSDSAVRAEVIESLGKRKAEAYILDLLGLINDESIDVQRAAIIAAAEITPLLGQGSRFRLNATHLTPLLDHTSSGARVLALKALADMADEIPEERLVSLLQKSLGGKTQSDNNEAISREEIEAVVNLLSDKCSEATVKCVLDAILNKIIHPTGRIALIRALSKMPSAVSNENVSESVWRALSSILTEESDSALKLAALETLAVLAHKTGDKSAIDLLSAQLIGSDESTEHTENVKVEQATTEPLQVDPNLIPAINVSEHEPAQEELNDILSMMNSRYPEEDLTLTNDQPAFISTLEAIQQNNIKQTLGAINAPDNGGETPEKELCGDERLRTLMDELPNDMAPFSDVVDQHLKTGDRLRYSRKKKANTPQFSNRVLAARAIGKAPTVESVSMLRSLLIEPDSELQVEVVTSLGRIARENPDISGLAECHGPFSTLLLAGTPALRNACAIGLGGLRHQAAIPVLRSALLDDDSNVRIAAIEALAECISSEANPFSRRDHVVLEDCMPQQVLEDISKTLDDEETGVVSAALKILAKHQHDAALSKVVNIGLQKPDLSKTAARVIKRFRADDVDVLLMPHLDSGNGKQRALAMTMIGEIYA